MPVRRTAPRGRPRRLSQLGLLGLLLPLALLVSSVPAQASPPQRDPGPAIEALSPYQGQTLCLPVAKPGVVAFRDLVLAAYPGTGDSGIARACDSEAGVSEHKEGRAWDWQVSIAKPAQVAQVDDLMRWLTATDQYGNTAAMVRRLGIMYIVWNHRIWKSYQIAKGWQPYTGPVPHTDHVHFSFSWAGAYDKTSYWTGVVAPVMSAPAAASSGLAPITVPATPTVATDPSAAYPDAGAAAPLSRSAWLQHRQVVLGHLGGPFRRH